MQIFLLLKSLIILATQTNADITTFIKSLIILATQTNADISTIKIPHNTSNDSRCPNQNQNC